MAWIPKYGEKYPHDNRYTYAPSQSSPQEHIELLKRYISVVPMLLPKSPELLRPTLRNLISAGTVCSYGMEKSRVSHRGEGIRERPDNFNELDEHEQERITDKIKRTATQDSYMMQTSLENPLLSRALDTLGSLPHGGTKAISFHGRGIEQHNKGGEGFNELQDFWDLLDGAVDREGFTFHENFDGAIDFFSEMRGACDAGRRGRGSRRMGALDSMGRRATTPHSKEDNPYSVLAIFFLGTAKLKRSGSEVLASEG
ncbi:hypothetical protein CIRG_09049 [Coccidioides immitis RMSCC 2394]|uniref:Uncharacterized protein n=1 Tax=Coccidioides immitis RMSCC 2394 TaxID=404692 RepID=A0A0J6YMC4_COCIT|nr:hypothetical protein CIRG_09049 [Coccidioides immitis RMSCC 2394]